MTFEANIRILTLQAVEDVQRWLRDGDEDYSDEDVAIAIRDWLTVRAQDMVDHIEMYALDGGLQKYLRHRCDIPGCGAIALEGDIFCRQHREREDAIIYTRAPDELEF